MLGTIIKYPESALRNRSARLFCSISLLAVLCVSRLNAQVVGTYGFEDGTADGWSSFNGATTPVATNVAAHGGSFSLLTTTGSGGAGGPAINVSTVLQAGAKYTITGFVQLTAGETATNANFTIKRSDPSCWAARASIRSVRSRSLWGAQGGRRLAEAIR